MPSECAGDESQVRQNAEAGRDAYTAGLYQAVINFPPGGGQAEKPGLARRVWGDVPARNLGFIGREQLLGAVREALVSGEAAVVQALRGMGGVGKTQLAAEYAHRYAPGYDVVWWITADQPGLIGEQVAALGAALGCAEPGTGLAVVRLAVLGALREQGRWLLVFDNADGPEDLERWLPGGAGHVLITSRAGGWEEIAVPVEVGVLARGESVTLLRRRVLGLGEADAGLVASAVGDLPLALAQAAGYMTATGTAADEYLKLLEQRAEEILDQGRPSSYPHSLAAVTQLALDRLAAADPAAVQAARVCAFLAAEPVPAEWFTSAAAQLPQPLRTVAADAVTWRQALARIGQQTLAGISQWSAPASLEAPKLADLPIEYHPQALYSRLPRTFSEAYPRRMSGSDHRYTTEPSQPLPPSHHPPLPTAPASR